MNVLSVAGVLVFMVASLVVGTRLFALWLRTRKLPELLLGIAVLCVGFLAYAVATLGKLLVDGGSDARPLMTFVGLSIECIGHVALISFAWRVFHAKAVWAGALAGALVAFIAAALVGEVVSGEYLRYSDSIPISGPYLLLGLFARGAAPTWVAFECFRFHDKLRRRMKIGLADPLVVNRVLLWGCALGASSLGFGMAIVHRLIWGTGLRAHVWALSSVSALAMVSALCIFLAFFPPERYRRWVQGPPPPAPPTTVA